MDISRMTIVRKQGRLFSRGQVRARSIHSCGSPAKLIQNERNIVSNTTTLAPNPKRLLWAGFMAILASGIGFAIRGGILDNWGREFGFTAVQLGAIGGAGLTGFCFGIVIGGVVADKIGYGKLVVAAFTFHVISAFVT